MLTTNKKLCYDTIKSLSGEVGIFISYEIGIKIFGTKKKSKFETLLFKPYNFKKKLL